MKFNISKRDKIITKISKLLKKLTAKQKVLIDYWREIVDRRLVQPLGDWKRENKEYFGQTKHGGDYLADKFTKETERGKVEFLWEFDEDRLRYTLAVPEDMSIENEDFKKIHTVKAKGRVVYIAEFWPDDLDSFERYGEMFVNEISGMDLVAKGKEPKNNEGRRFCWWCRKKTIKVPGYTQMWDECPECRK